MPAGLRRFYGKGDLHFVTFSCFRRLPLLDAPRTRDLFVTELEKVRGAMGFRLIGYVVMPNHVHLLISESPRGTPSTVLHKLKLGFSRKLRKREKVARAAQLRLARETACEKPLPSFWLSRFYDFNVHSTGKLREKLDYMHANPVIRGLVQHPKDWPWSSWSFYATGKTGLIRIDAA